MNSSASVSHSSRVPFDPQQRRNAIDFRRRYLQVLQRAAAEWSKPILPNGRYVGIEFSEPNFPLKPMNPIYADEQISYFEDLEPLQVFPINGLIHQSDLSLYSSRVPLIPIA